MRPASGFGSLVSSILFSRCGSYFKRDQYAWRDYTILYEFLYGAAVPPTGVRALWDSESLF